MIVKKTEERGSLVQSNLKPGPGQYWEFYLNQCVLFFPRLPHDLIPILKKVWASQEMVDKDTYVTD
jgi:hypothetical protein